MSSAPREKTLLTKSFHNALIRPCPVIPNRDTVLVFCDREATIVLLSVFTQTLSVYVISLAFCYLGCIVVWSFRLRSGSGLVIFSQTVTIFCIQIATFSYFTSRHTGWKKLSSLLWLKRVLLKQTFRKMSLKNIFFSPALTFFPVTSAGLVLLSVTQCGILCYHHNWAVIKAQSRITANKVASLLQLQTCFSLYNFFAIKAQRYLVI